jgi:hypothetical protein
MMLIVWIDRGAVSYLYRGRRMLSRRTLVHVDHPSSESIKDPGLTVCGLSHSEVIRD